MRHNTDRFVIYADCRHLENLRTGRILRKIEWQDKNTNNRIGFCTKCIKKQREKLEFEKTMNEVNLNGNNGQNKILLSEEGNKENTGGNHVQQTN